MTMINDVAAKSRRGCKSQGRMRQGSLLSARCIPSQIITKIMMSIVKIYKDDNIHDGCTKLQSEGMKMFLGLKLRVVGQRVPNIVNVTESPLIPVLYA